MVKISPVNLIEKIKREELKLNALLLFGNEEGTITGLIKEVYNHVKQKNNIGEILYLDHKKDLKISIKDIIDNRSLFFKKNFIVVKNTTEKICDELKNCQFGGNIVIISGEEIKSNSKIKKYFDAHKVFISVPCYKLKRGEKIKIIDTFISNNNIIMEKHTYWYLVENISNDYLILEKELEKILAYNNSSLSIDNLKILLIQEINASFDEIFFKCANKNAAILLKDTNSFIKSQSDSYVIIGNLKKFVQIFSLALTNKDIKDFDVLTNTYLPKYLFMKKDAFKEILKKISLVKITKMIKLIQKTEILLRKNSSHYLEITQRFLLNFSKLMR